MANAYINIQQELSPSDLFYINTNKQLQADTITSTSAIFTGASILNPSTFLSASSITSFEFYVNGQNIPSPYISIDYSYGSGVKFDFVTSSIGYGLETDDEIIAIGKFA
jgi:hypothetical protein